MTLRPIPARWFELLVARNDLTNAVEALAASGAIELEQREEILTPDRLPDYSARVEEYRRLSARYRPYWPETSLDPRPPGLVADRLALGLERLHAWRQAADPIILELDGLRVEQSNLALIDELLTAAPAEADTLAEVAASGPLLAGRLFVLPQELQLPPVTAALLLRELRTPTNRFGLVVGEPQPLAILEQELVALKARPLAIPRWFSSVAQRLPAAIAEHQRVLAQQIDQLSTRLDALHREYKVASAIADLERVEWFMAQVGSLPVSENFAWVTGWTDDVSGWTLRRALARGHIRAVLRFPPTPGDKTPPVVMFNPRWIRPFEMFARLLGTPARDEADPTLLLAVIAPLLFGYMFCDVGQGLVLLALGLWLQKRLPAMRLLIAGGLASIIFGLLFGSIFNLELLPALWLRPLDHPLLVLGVPLAGGILILLLGLVLNAIEALWRGHGLHWLETDAPLLLLYLTLLATLLDPRSAWLVPPLLAWYVLGALAVGGMRLGALGQAIGDLLETLMQLAVNTLSFSRVGAFALAHAGLALAVVQLAQSTGTRTGFVLALVLGNVVMIALEGLVVAIQTTRLILFEFFIRFYRGGGRVFHPLTAPVASPSARRTA